MTIIILCIIVASKNKAIYQLVYDITMGEQFPNMHETFIQYRYINYTDDIIEQKEHGKGYRKKIIIVGGKYKY